MEKYFKSVNGVVDVVSFEPQEGSDWVATQEPVFAGFLWDGETLTPPELPPKYSDAASATDAMIEWINNFTVTITGPIPLDEKLSWDAKEAASRAYIAGTADASQSSMIESEASITQELPSTLAATIISKSDAFKTISALMAGLRRKTIAAIDAVDNPKDYETVLKNANDEALSLAQSLGIT